MGAFEDFKVGDRVIHGGDEVGTVTSIDGCVHVKFDRKMQRGKDFVGSYDRNWFRIYPHLLNHARKG